MSTASKTTGRPSAGYKNSAGKRVPGVTTILGRFKDSGGLIQWAYNCGLNGIDINEARDKAADAGSACHEMIHAHLHGQPFDRSTWDPEIILKAEHAFLGFLEWQKQTGLCLVASEVSLVSEKYQYGGTMDLANKVGGEVLLLDLKSGNGVYVEFLSQLGGYSLLWEEHHPEQKISGLQIVRVTKPETDEDPITFHHHYFSAEILPLVQRQFLIFREAYANDQRLKKML